MMSQSRWSLLLVLFAAATSAAAAQGQIQSQTTPGALGDICLTNACSQRPEARPSLAEAFAACDLEAALAAGGTARDAARILKGRGQAGPGMDPSTAAWVKNGPDSFALAYQTTTPPGARGFVLPLAFRGYAPPDVATLPTADEAYGGPPPPPPPPSAELSVLANSVMAGMTAPEAAARYIAANPPPADRVVDTAQADFRRSVRTPGLVLYIPSYMYPMAGQAVGGFATSQIILPGTENYPGLPAMLAENQSSGIAARASPEVARALAAYTPAGPPRDC